MALGDNLLRDAFSDRLRANFTGRALLTELAIRAGGHTIVCKAGLRFVTTDVEVFAADFAARTFWHAGFAIAFKFEAAAHVFAKFAWSLIGRPVAVVVDSVTHPRSRPG